MPYAEIAKMEGFALFNIPLKKMSQITQHILMIQPVSFRFNEQTAVNNYYQKVLDGLSPEAIQAFRV